MLPVIDESRIIILDGEFGISRFASELQLLLVYVIYIALVKHVGDDYLGLGTDQFFPQCPVNQAIFVESPRDLYRTWCLKQVSEPPRRLRVRSCSKISFPYWYSVPMIMQ